MASIQQLKVALTNLERAEAERDRLEREYAQKDDREEKLRENVARMNGRARKPDKPAGQLTTSPPAPRTPARPAPEWVRQALWFMFVCACAMALASIANQLVL